MIESESFELTKASNHMDFERFFPVLKQLRPDLLFSDYVSIYEVSRKNDGYEIVALEKQWLVGSVMGYRALCDFVHGRHLYIDDLVTSETFRSQGLGAILLKLCRGSCG